MIVRRSCGHRTVAARLPHYSSQNTRGKPNARVTHYRTWAKMETRLRKFSNSAQIVIPSGHSWRHLKQSYDHRWCFSVFGNNFVIGGKIFGMPKNPRRTLRRFIFVLNSCAHLALRKAIVMASCQIVLASSLLRVIIGAIGRFAPHEHNTKETRSYPKATRLREALVMPSCSHRIIVRWHRDETTPPDKSWTPPPDKIFWIRACMYHSWSSSKLSYSQHDVL